MYGLPPGFNALRLIGCKLEQVSFSVNTVHFSFSNDVSNDVSVTTESCYTHSAPGDAGNAVLTRVPVRESRLMQLLGESIESAGASTDGTLTLTFTNGHRLVFHDDTPQYEAYRIRIGNDEFIV